MLSKKTFSYILMGCGVCFAAGGQAYGFDYARYNAGYSQGIKLSVSDDQVLAGAKSFVGSVAQRGIDFLSDDKITPERRKAEFRKLLKDSFAMKSLGRFALGRYWRTSTAAQRQEYLKLFEEMVLDVYASRFGEYTDQTFDIRDIRKEGKSDSLVTSFIVPKSGPEIQVDWRVRYKNKKYLVVDVIVEGVSMAVTQRSDFSSVIQRGGGKVDVLIAHLREN